MIQYELMNGFSNLKNLLDSGKKKKRKKMIIALVSIVVLITIGIFLIIK